MFTQSDSTPPLKTRKQSAEAINRAMTRFPLIVEILGELDKASVPFAGDEDIRHGCERALTAMLAELARIEPAPFGKPVKAEDNAKQWLHSTAAERLVNADQLQRIDQLIERILGTHQEHH
jgi:hypothetical protein